MVLSRAATKDRYSSTGVPRCTTRRPHLALRQKGHALCSFGLPGVVLPASVTEVTHLFFGDLVGRVHDPLGNLYWIPTRVEELSQQEMERRLGDPECTKAMEYVQSADFFSGRASDLV